MNKAYRSEFTKSTSSLSDKYMNPNSNLVFGIDENGKFIDGYGFMNHYVHLFLYAALCIFNVLYAPLMSSLFQFVINQTYQRKSLLRKNHISLTNSLTYMVNNISFERYINELHIIDNKLKLEHYTDKEFVTQHVSYVIISKTYKNDKTDIYIIFKNRLPSQKVKQGVIGGNNQILNMYRPLSDNVNMQRMYEILKILVKLPKNESRLRNKIIECMNDDLVNDQELKALIDNNLELTTFEKMQLKWRFQIEDRMYGNVFTKRLPMLGSQMIRVDSLVQHQLFYKTADNALDIDCVSDDILNRLNAIHMKYNVRNVIFTGESEGATLASLFGTYYEFKSKINSKIELVDKKNKKKKKMSTSTPTTVIISYDEGNYGNEHYNNFHKIVNRTCNIYHYKFTTNKISLYEWPFKTYRYYKDYAYLKHPTMNMSSNKISIGQKFSLNTIFTNLDVSRTKMYTRKLDKIVRYSHDFYLR